MVLVSIDGNIGSGKTSLLAALRERGMRVDPEPVEEWGPLLEKLYSNQLKPYDFQLRVYHDRCVPPPVSGVIERSPHFQFDVFVSANATRMTAEELGNLRKLYSSSWTPDVFIYLRATPDLCAKRIAQRGRAGEDGISAEYLEKLHSLHEVAFKRVGVNGHLAFVVDADAGSPDVLADEVCRLIERCP